jgi:hypothetical protein
MISLTRKDVTAVLGPLDHSVAAEIIATPVFDGLCANPTSCGSG